MDWSIYSGLGLLTVVPGVDGGLGDLDVSLLPNNLLTLECGLGFFEPDVGLDVGRAGLSSF